MYTKTTFEQLNNAGRCVIEYIKHDKSDYTRKQFDSLHKHALPKLKRQNSPYCNTPGELMQAVANALSRAKYFGDFVRFECYGTEIRKWSKGDKDFKIDYNTQVSVKNYFATEIAKLALQ